VAPRLIAVALGLWGVALTAGLLTDSFPATLFARDGAQPRGEPARGGRDDGDGTPATTSAQLPGAHGPANSDALIAMTPRHAVCDDARGGARMTLHRLDAAALLAVHCGERVLWLSLAPGGPRLEASLALNARAEGAVGHALSPAVADVDADGRTDLIAPYMHIDAAGTPKEGGVAVLARPAGAALTPPRRIVGGYPRALVHGRFDGKGVALGLLGPGDSRVAGEHALSLLSSEPAPKTTITLAAGDAHSAVALDLDLDGRDDVVLGGARASAGWWLSAGEAKITTHALGPVRETLSGDLSGDGNADALLVGDGLWILQASKQGAFTPSAIEATQCKGDACMRDVQLVDLDHDGKLDIVGYIHPGLRWLRARGGLRYESRPLSRIEGDAMSILQALVTDADGDGLPDLLLLGHVKGSPAAVELAVVGDIQRHEIIRLGGDPLPIETSALAPAFALR